MKKKMILIIAEYLLGSASTTTSFALTIVNPSVGIIISSSSALITSIATLFKNQKI